MQYPPITNVHLNLTHRCNLACRYCYVHQHPLDMTYEVARYAVDFLATNSLKNKDKPRICFFGGEPLLMYESIIVPIVEYIETTYPEIGFTFTITTNSVLLTNDKIKFLKEHKFGILTSIDGCPATQNYNRPLHGGRASMSIIEPHIKSVLNAGFTPTFRSTIIPATCHNAYEDYLYAINLGYKSLFAITNAYEKWDEAHEKILEQEYYKIADHYIQHTQKHRTPPISMSLLNRFIEASLKGVTTARKNDATTHCGLGQSNVAAISPVGDIYGCQELTSNEGRESIFYIGNIYTGTIDERRKRLADTFNSNSTKGDMACSSCEANIVCNGGCVANNYMITGQLNDCPHGHCFFQRILTRVAKYVVDSLKDVPEFAQSFKRKPNVNAKTTPITQSKTKSFTPQSQNAKKSCKNCDSCQVCDTCQIKDSARD